MKVTILGNNSALPAYGRYPTSQVVEIHEQYFLMDCGEGAQMRMQQFGVRSARINHIFISHLHGDHYLGLVGFISSLSLLGREKELYLYCPKELKKIIDIQLPWSLGFPLIYRFIEDDECSVLLETEKVEISCFPVTHSVPTHGFLFTEKKRKRILIPDKAKEYNVPQYYYSKLTEGFDYENRFGDVVKNEWVTLTGNPSKRYAFCADTRFDLNISTFIQGVDLMYHEATYLQDQQQKAIDRLHSTAMEAAQVAKEAGAKRLLLGHFSSKYKVLEPFLEEAKPIFEFVELALEGLTFEV